MSTSAISGVGTKLYRSTTVDGTYTAVAEIPNIDGPNKSRDTHDVTDLDSTGGYKEFKPAFRDGGEITIDMFFTQAGYMLMNDDFEQDDVRYYKIVMPNTDQTIFRFAAYVTNLGFSIPADGIVTAPVTLKISGQITMFDGSSTTSQL